MRSLMCIAALVAAALLSGGCATVSSCGSDCGGGCGTTTGLLSNGCDTGCGDCATDDCNGGCGLGLRGRGLPRLGLFASGNGMNADCGDCSGVSSGPMNGVFAGSSCDSCGDGGGCGSCQMGMSGAPGLGRMSLPRPALGCGKFGCGARGQLCVGCGLKGRLGGMFGKRAASDCETGCEDDACNRGGLFSRIGAKRALGDNGCDDGSCGIGGGLRGGIGSRLGDGCGCGRGCGLGRGCRTGLHPYGGQIPHTANAPHAGGLAPQYAYPYYTTRGPRDFLQANPMSIGR